MIYDSQPMLEPGFKDMNGNVWPINWVRSYNLFTRDINKSANIPLKSSSLLQQERDLLLDNRHRFFVWCCAYLERNTVKFQGLVD